MKKYFVFCYDYENAVIKEFVSEILALEFIEKEIATTPDRLSIADFSLMYGETKRLKVVNRIEVEKGMTDEEKAERMYFP